VHTKTRKISVGKMSVQPAQAQLFDRRETIVAASLGTCEIVSVGRRRDGGTRYWCLHHKADATAKYGVPAAACRTAHLPPLKRSDTFLLDLDRYEGGVALWGAVPPVYDTTLQPMDRGVHVHARRAAEGDKDIDRTYRAVRIIGGVAPKRGLRVDELDAIYYMVSSVFGYGVKEVTCTYCGYSHLDRDWFSVHPHRRHLCAGCGRHFRDDATSIGNPISGIREICGTPEKSAKLSKKKFIHRQDEYPGGIQIWGSNPAFLWTGEREEEDGIHVHAFRDDQSAPDDDDTFGVVIIDGVKLDAVMVRTLMAQSTLPHLANRVVSINCPFCDSPAFDDGDRAFTPVVERTCAHCGRKFSARGRLRKTIANPLPAILDGLGRNATRPPRKHTMDLLPETL
jgi:hypothetical protein